MYHRLDDEFHFTVDAAASKENRLCHIWYGPGGLREDALEPGPFWEGRLFCNPPYGRDVGEWCRIAALSVRSGLAEVVVLLLPARTDTVWFHEWVVHHAAVIRFLRVA